MFNDKTQFIYEKYLSLLTDFAEQYADELPERTKVMFQKSLVKYYDNELSEAMKHERFMIRAKNMLFKRALRAQNKLARLPSITQQNVSKALQSLGLQEEVSDEIMRLMLLGLCGPTQQEDSCFEDNIDDKVDSISTLETNQVSDESSKTVEDDSQPIVDGKSEEKVDDHLDVNSLNDGNSVEKVDDHVETNSSNYWSSRRKNRTKLDVLVEE